MNVWKTLLTTAIVITLFVVAIVITCILIASKELIKPYNLKSNIKGHPFLYFDRDDIPRLQLAMNSSHKFLADDIKKITEFILRDDRLPPRNYTSFAAKWNERYGNDLPVLCMYCILYPDDKKVFEYVVEYMDRLATFKNWRTTSAPRDEYPVTHILIGFVTAFDFLYARFDKPRKRKYIRQIINNTKEMYEMSNKKWWGKAYLQNHVFTNLVALLTGSLVLEPYDKRATLWKNTAVKLLERSMYLLGYVTDGSLTEGDHYHAYSTRSITQYVYLCKRHIGVDHTSHPWLTSVFWYYYGTALPGLKDPVGFADNHPGWTYGYEASLFFLDKFVLRTGNANWLGMKIRHRNSNGTNFARSGSILSKHLEYLWYDQSLKPKAPFTENLTTLYKYPDIGVVTFRTSTELIPNNTFLSFKSGKLHGEFVSKLVNDKPKWLNGWSSFNPGHEQPDRNSFTFAPHGVAMVTEGVKNYKYTYLDNTLMFKPSGVSIDSCVNGWIGQIGECSTYLKYGKRNPSGLSIDAEIVTSTLNDKIVHVAGEAKGAYHPKLQLESFYRNLLLLAPEVMLVVDHIQLKQNSPIQFISSFLNNRYFGFKKIKGASGMESISLDHPKYKDYRIAWVMDDLGSSTVNITNNFTSPMLTSFEHTLNNINITFNMKSGHNIKRIAYIFHGPNSYVKEFLFSNTSNIGVTVKLVVNNETFKISLPTNYRDKLSRQQFLKQDGFYSLQRSTPVKEARNTANDNTAKVSRSVYININKINSTVENKYSSHFYILNIDSNLNKDKNISNNPQIESIFVNKNDYSSEPPYKHATGIVLKLIVIVLFLVYLIMTKNFFITNRIKEGCQVIRSLSVSVKFISCIVILAVLLLILIYLT